MGLPRYLRVRPCVGGLRALKSPLVVASALLSDVSAWPCLSMAA